MPYPRNSRRQLIRAVSPNERPYSCGTYQLVACQWLWRVRRDRSDSRVMPVTSPLSPWESFYVIVGSSAAALTGLQFVVMALVSSTQRRTGGSEVSTFGTPTIV